VAAQRSPAYSLITRHRVALPLHPEFRTMPMVWYIPPLSPVADVTAAAGYDDADPDAVFATIDALRVPIEYLANLFTAGRPGPVRDALAKLAVMRAMMRAHQLGLPAQPGPRLAGFSDADAEDLFRLLAIARYEDRYVVPPAHAEDAGQLIAQHSFPGCSLEGGPGMGGPEGAGSFHLTKRDDKGRLHMTVAGGEGS
jgi:nitrate reductase / nitrite oxidoreductase, beta subunit